MLSFCPTCMTHSHLKKKRRKCQQVLECLSLWATLLTQRQSTRRIWGKRWSSWCWIRRIASPLLMVSSIRVSINPTANYCLLGAHIEQLQVFTVLIKPIWILEIKSLSSAHIQTSQRTGRRNCSRSSRSTRWWLSQTTKTTNGTKRSRRCFRQTTARQLPCVCVCVCPVLQFGPE